MKFLNKIKEYFNMSNYDKDYEIAQDAASLDVYEKLSEEEKLMIEVPFETCNDHPILEMVGKNDIDNFEAYLNIYSKLYNNCYDMKLESAIVKKIIATEAINVDEAQDYFKIFKTFTDKGSRELWN
jgi:hypothetical protein